MTDPVIRIVLADDHAVLRAGLRALLNAESDIVVVGEAGDGEEALHAIAVHQPDIIVLDLMMPKDWTSLSRSANHIPTHACSF